MEVSEEEKLLHKLNKLNTKSELLPALLSIINIHF